MIIGAGSVGYLHCKNNLRTDWGFRTVPQPGLNGRALNYPRGRVLGGWRQLGKVGWGWDDVLPYFLKSKHHFAPEDGFHGGDGEWRVEQQRLHWPILDSVRDAAAEMGIPKVADFNRGDNEGSSYFRVNQRRGVRWNMAKALLRPALERPNLTVLTGVDCRQRNEALLLGADTEVILAAGAIGSPHILQYSGIGPGPVLQKFGIDTRHELPEVGADLRCDDAQSDGWLAPGQGADCG